MRAYKFLRLTNFPSVNDIIAEGRKSIVGRIPRGEADCPRYKNNVVQYADGTPGIDLNEGKIVHNDRGYCRPLHKKAVRRYLKRRDRAIAARFDRDAER
jgi:hypothetical protein